MRRRRPRRPRLLPRLRPRRRRKMRIPEAHRLSARARVYILSVCFEACVPLRQPRFFAFVEFDQFSVLSTQAAASCAGVRFS